MNPLWDSERARRRAQRQGRCPRPLGKLSCQFDPLPCARPCLLVRTISVMRAFPWCLPFCFVRCSSFRLGRVSVFLNLTEVRSTTSRAEWPQPPLALHPDHHRRQRDSGSPAPSERCSPDKQQGPSALSLQGEYSKPWWDTIAWLRSYCRRIA